MEHDSYVLISVQSHEDVNDCVVISLSCQRTGTCLVLSSTLTLTADLGSGVDQFTAVMLSGSQLFCSIQCFW